MFTIYTKDNCGHCVSAKQALKIKKLDFQEILHDTDEAIENFKAKGYRTFPQVFRDGVHLGGNDQLQMYLLDQY